jgi:hypothetical protein
VSTCGRDPGSGLGVGKRVSTVVAKVTIELGTNGSCLKAVGNKIFLFCDYCRRKMSEVMKSKIQFIAIGVVWTLISFAGTQRALGQHPHDHSTTEWKKGMVRLNETAWVGEVRLKSGMYHVKHVVEGDKHWLVFNAVTLGAGYREGQMWEGKEIARLECNVEPAARSLRNTKVILTKAVGGMRKVQEIQIAGERVRHILLTNEPTVGAVR